MKISLRTLFFAFLLTACTFGTTQTVEPVADSPTATPSARTITTSFGETINLAGPAIGTTMLWVDNSILVYVPGGDFIMGANDGDNPQHTVTVSPFWIYRSEVNNAQYAACIAAGECSPLQDQEAASKLADPTLRERPVVGVMWEQADAYCKWAQGELPTEAQWEKTARGPQGNIYPWGEGEPSCDLINFNSCLGDTSNIRQYPSGKSYYEVLDLAGNVFEWVRDWYDLNYYPTAPLIDPQGPPNGLERSVRGGSFQSSRDDVLSANRFSLDPIKVRPDLGFRCIVENPAYFPPFCQANPIYTSNAKPVSGGADGGSSSSACEPPNVQVGGSYCNEDVPYANIFTDGDLASEQGGNVLCSFEEDGLYTCHGPQSTVTEVEVCGSCDSPDQQDAGQNIADPMQPGPDQTCPNVGYDFNPVTQTCEWAVLAEEPVAGCPPGYFEEHPDRNSCDDVPLVEYCPSEREFDPTTGRCVVPAQPADGQGVCPNPGYTFNPDTQMCEWNLHNRPAGLCLDSEGVQWVPGECEPGGSIDGFSYFCPIGSVPDDSGQFCVQPAGGNDDPVQNCPNGLCDPAENELACPVGTYFDLGINLCAPASGNPPLTSCIPGFNFDAERGCCQSTSTVISLGCPIGQLMDPLLGCIKPPTVNEESGVSCVTVKIDLPKCDNKFEDGDPGGEEETNEDDGEDDGGGTINVCSQFNGDYKGCRAAGCSYDTATNSCN